jgi:sugar phosphate isomerase/epimerase
MRLGLLTAAFPDTPLTEVAGWAAGNGLAALEVACWPATPSPPTSSERRGPGRGRRRWPGP